MNIMGLGDPVGFESLEEGRASQRKVASLSFEAAWVWPWRADHPRCVDPLPQ
jgi:hypothetical protein